MSTNQPLLDIKNLSIAFKTSFGQIEAVRSISFQLQQGETLGIVGESGCGKSLTNLALMGLLPSNAIVTADKMEFMGEDLKKKTPSQMQKMRGKKMAMVFQDPMSALNPCYTVAFLLEESLKAHTSLDKTQRQKRCLELLDQVGIAAAKERLKCYPHELSGGMAQRVMMAMALACSPHLLIADEPTTALDVTIQDQILRLLFDLQKQHNMAMILVTHDLGVVAQNANRLQVMYAGEIVETGITDSVIAHPLHPYTRGLLDCLPSHQGHAFRSPLPSIPGLVPSLRARPQGCQFHPRCLKAEQRCQKELPLLETKNNGEQFVSCFYPMQGEER